MRNAMRWTLACLFLIVAAPAWSASVVDIFMCQQDEEATKADLERVAKNWLAAARSMDGGADLELYLRFPVVASIGNSDFAAVLVAPSLEMWGKFMDGFEGSPAAKVGKEEFSELADCTDNQLWEVIKIE